MILALLGRPRERLTQAEAKMRLIILIILIILIVGAVPAWPYSAGWGYYPVGGTRDNPNHFAHSGFAGIRLAAMGLKPV